MVATMSFLNILLAVLSLSSFALAQNITAPLSFIPSNLTTSLFMPSTVFVTSTPGQSTVKATTFITQPGYQNTTSFSFSTPVPTESTPFTFTSPDSTSSSTPTSSPTLLHNAAPSLKLDVLPVMVGAMALLVGLQVH